MSEKKTNEKVNQPSTPSGIHRAVPIILSALSAFTAVCFVTSGSGAVGNAVSTLLRGLFSFGAYAIPLVLIIHAICYKSDLSSGRLLGRSVFSILTVLLISAIDYAVFDWSNAIDFSPAARFTGLNGGGFIGSMLGYLLAILFGRIGVIILSVATIAVYAVFFYAEKAGSIGKIALAILERMHNASEVRKAKRQARREHKAQLREEAEQLRREQSSEKLIDDDFFRARGESSGVKIRKLGIDDEAAPGGTSSLTGAFKSTVTEQQYSSPEQKQRRSDRPVNLSYGEEDKPVVQKKSNEFNNAFLGIDDSADNVFTKDFDPFDFATSEKAAAKLTSRSAPVEEELDEFALAELKANHIPTEREKRLADLERRKKEWLYQKMKREGKLEAPEAPAAKPDPIPEPEPVPTVEFRGIFDTMAPAKPTSSAATDALANLFADPAPSYARSYSPAPTESNESAASEGSSGNQNEPVSAPAVTDSVRIDETPVTVSEPAPARPVSPTAVPAQPTVAPQTTAPSNHYSTYPSTKTTYSQPIKTVEFTITKEPSVSPAPAAKADPIPAPSSEATEDIAILIGERIARSNPAYARSANDLKTYTKVTSSSSDDELFRQLAGVNTDNSAQQVGVLANSNAPSIDFHTEPVQSAPVTPNFSVTGETDIPKSYDFAPAPAQTVQAEPVATEPDFKPYAPENPINTPSPIVREENSLKIERTMLPPVPEAISFNATDAETQSEISAPSESGIPLFDTVDEVGFEEDVKVDAQGSEPEWTSQEEDNMSTADNSEDEDVLDFDSDLADNEDEDEDEYDVLPDEIPDEIPDEEDDAQMDEIPPEEQNPDVIKMRQMFPILEPLDQQSTNIPQAQENSPAPAPQSHEFKEETRTFEPVVKKEDPKAEPAKNALVPAEKKKKEYSNYVFPSIDLLSQEKSNFDENVQAEIQENADKLIETLASFGVTASIKGVDRGPRITRYEVVPARGVKVSQILNLQDDIALNLAAGDIRMEAPIPGKSAVGIEVPNKKSSIVRLRALLETAEFKYSNSKTLSCVGRDIAGQPVFCDLASMPHLLIAGATGMGKSVCINSLLISILYKAKPDEVKFIMIDPKQVEFTMYDGIPHLLVPVVSDPKKAAGALMWAVEEMERRFEMLRPLCVRNIDAYNEKVNADPSLGDPMSKIIIVIDEFADLMLQVKDPVESLVMRIAQKARAAGIHLLIGTQRPSVNVITGVIKANIPSRISCKVMSNVDSKTILDMGGAEKLLDKGDSLYAPKDAAKPHRVQCAFVSDSEVESIMNHLRQFSDGSSYDSSVMEEIERAAQKCSKKGDRDRDDDMDDDDTSGEGYLNDRQFLDAVEVAVNTRKISTSLIQRKLSVGYGKAAKFIDIMEDMGIVGESNGSRPREVLLTPDEWREKLARASLD